MGQALYRKYRSSSFDEVIGQDHITTTLKHSLNSGKFAHAYLMAGPRGVGKTSVARILAYEVNGLPYDEKSTNMDIIEIDAASNRRIDEVRELRERVRIAPVSAKYKVYIIDEVHMLTREAFNALLKTLEEPPEHAIFILATTEMHRLPDTIVSRCITFTFHAIEPGLLSKHLKFIAKQEKIDISNDALQLLAQYSEGSFRDSISLLDQVKDLSSKVTPEDIELALGLAPAKIVEDILNAVIDRDPKMLEKALSEAFKFGANEPNLAKQLGEKVRQQLIAGKSAFAAQDATSLLKDLLDVSAAPNPKASLEICLLNLLFRDGEIRLSEDTGKSKDTAAGRVDETAEINLALEPDSAAEGLVPNPQPDQIPIIQTIPANTIAKIQADSELWANILSKLKARNNTLYSVARMADAQHKDDTLTLAFKFPFHFKQVANPKNKSLLLVIIEELGHRNVSVEIKLTADSKPGSPKPPTSIKKGSSDPNLANITNIFGSGEMLES